MEPAARGKMTASSAEEAAMTVTVFIRYQLDPFKRADFEAYARRWLKIIPRLGGNLLATGCRTRAPTTSPWR
jgi:hypothetical protein